MLLVVGWAAQAGLRAWLSRGQVVPLATPDESAYLIAARVLAGGLPVNFSYSTLYPAGYPLLITPVFWFTHDPVTAYHAVLMINALPSALVLPLGFAACRRMGLDPPLAYWVAFAGSLLPAGLFYAEYAMTDAIYPVIVLGWLLCVHGWLVSPSRRGRYAANTTGLISASRLRPGQVLAVGKGVSWESWMPQAYEIPWAQLEFFSPGSGGPPAGASVVEVAWPGGQSASASWPGAPAGWRIVASDEAAGWVAWRK